MRVVLDTNVRVSGLAFPGRPPDRLVSAWRADDERDFLDLLRAVAQVVELGTGVLAGQYPILSPADFCARQAP